MFASNDRSVLWVSPSAENRGDGSRDNPFGDVRRALTAVKQGMTIVMMGGIYGRDTTFDISGGVHQPIRIIAQPGAAVEVVGARWFFYDASDLIVSGVTFRDAPGGAVSVIGACMRNRFDGLRFVDCGREGAVSCALFFGGSGGSCNVVENCRFERTLRRCPATAEAGKKAVGLMVSEGDDNDGEPLVDHVFRRNYFVNYDYGVLIGAGDAPAGQYGHIVEYNTVEQCRDEGIMVKCSDTTVRGNRVVRCPNRSIVVAAGRDSIVESNRTIDCGRGIQVNGNGHTVANNCIVRCGGEAVGVNGTAGTAEQRSASNVLIENNTCIDCGTAAGSGGTARVAGVRIGAGITGIVRRNLFSGEGKPCAGRNGAWNRRTRGSASLIIENIAANRCETMEGVDAAAVTFRNPAGGDFTNDSRCGASGWVLRPETFDPHGDDIDEANDYRCGREETDSETGEACPLEDVGGAEITSFMGKFYSKEIPRDKTDQL